MTLRELCIDYGNSIVTDKNKKNRFIVKTPTIVTTHYLELFIYTEYTNTNKVLKREN